MPQDTNGILDLSSVVAKSAPDAAVYACGPEPMLKALAEVCADANAPRALRLERFAAAPTANTEPEQNEPFELELRRTGVTLVVPPDRSILSVAREAVANLPFSCTEGVCGSCEAGVVAGIPEHRDSVLTEEERQANETMMICVGRSLTPRLVLDL